MKYSIRIEIELPRERVIELFDDPSYMGAWQPSLVQFERLTGESGEQGTISRSVHKMGKREVEMIETVTCRELPDLFAGTYEAKGVWNEVVNRFSELDDDRTGWQVESEFRCTGLMWLMCKLAPGMFKNETLAHMKRFKAFAEGVTPS